MCEAEEGERAVGHCGLDFLDARGGCVFLGFGVVVEEVGGAVGGLVWGMNGGWEEEEEGVQDIFGARHVCWWVVEVATILEGFFRSVEFPGLVVERV